MYHTPFTWYEQENLGYKAHFEAFPRALWSLRLFTKAARRSYRPVRAFTKPLTQRF
jgi:hypothetical protein